MNALQQLLDQFWIVKERDKERFYQIKRNLGAYERFVNERLGWNLIANESVIKLEKLPPRSMPWMGIEKFSDALDYCLLCALLIFLEDKEDGEQFLLSELIESLETLLSPHYPIDWTRYPHRKSLVRVLEYTQSLDMLLAYDGKSDDFGASQDQEVLYENTGLSRDFSVHFGRDISHCSSVEDFEAFIWAGESEEELRQQRIHRVYRQLVLSPALYWSSDDRADYEYVKNQRPSLQKNLKQALGGELEIHRNGAFLVLDAQDGFGLQLPNRQGRTDLALLLCAQLREQIVHGELALRVDDRAALSREDFRRLLQQCRTDWGEGWAKELREMQLERLERDILEFMKDWMLIEEGGEDMLLICPAAGKWTGAYPKSYIPQEGGESDDTSLEDA